MLDAGSNRPRSLRWRTKSQSDDDLHQCADGDEPPEEPREFDIAVTHDVAESSMTAFASLFDLCWKSKVSLALLALGLVMEVCKLLVGP